MKTTLLSILLLCSVLVQAQVYNGNIILSNQFQVNLFNYTEVTGYLDINGDDITDLSPLLSLTSVGTDLHISSNAALTSIAGLANLASVGGDLFIYYNNTLTSISGLGNLTSVGQVLHIEGNNALTSIAGLGNLTSVGDYIRITNNAALTSLTGLEKLTTIHGDLTISNNIALTSFAGLNNVTVVWKDLEILNNAALTSISGLGNLTTVGGNLDIKENNALTNLIGLANLKTVREIITISSNDVLSSITGIANLASAKHLFILSNPALTSLIGLENLTSLEWGLTISGNPALTSLAGLENLTSLGSFLGIGNNAALTSIAALRNLNSAGEVQISNNAALTNLTGLENLTSLKAGLTISGNPVLTSLAALESLTSLEFGALTISGNPALTSIAGLENLISVGTDLHFSHNAALTSIEGLGNLTSVGGDLFIYDNNSLTSLAGLENLTLVGDILTIRNSTLTNLAGLENLNSVGGVQIIDNAALTNLTALENLTSLELGLTVSGNPALTNLVGLENITSIEVRVLISNNNLLSSLAGLENLTSLEGSLNIYDNDVLSSFCSLFELINAYGLMGTYNIHDNAVNPTKQQIIDNGPCISNTPPLAVCQNVTVPAGENCQAMVTADQVNNGSTDPDGNEISLSISPEGPYGIGVTNVILTVDDGNGETATCEATVTVYDDIPPLITCPSEIYENSATGFCGTQVNFTITASDNCEGTVTVLSSPSSGSFFPVGTTTVTSTATDAAGNESSCSFKVTVIDNIVPTVVTHDLTVQLDINGSANIVPADIDNGSLDNCKVESYKLDITDFDCDDVASNPIEVTLTVTDIHGNSASNTANVTVKDEIAPIVETQDLIVQLDKDGFTSISPADIDKGSSDACGISSLSVTPNVFTCANVGNNTVTLIVTDVNGNLNSKTANVLVQNDSPVIDAFTTSSLDPMQLGTPATITVYFTDYNATEVNIQWGDFKEDDYTTSTGVVNATHNYLLPGVYTVIVTVTDPCGEMTVSDYKYIVIYDPSAGFVTGGGWIFSPEGAYKPDPLLTGKASFGFVSKYKKGSSVPTGNTEFQFHAGSMNFNSTNYEWLVIAGSKAKFKGSGTINGFGNYGFILSAIDADLTPSADIDKFRIKIWDQDNGDVVVYDNNQVGDDDADPTTEIGGGSIIIHTSDKKSAEIESDMLPSAEASSLLVYPNPFNDRLQFEFVSLVDGHARIDLYDSSGRILQTVFDSPVEGGVHYNAEFIPASEISGIIFYRMTLGMEVFSGKVVFNK